MKDKDITQEIIIPAEFKRNNKNQKSTANSSQKSKAAPGKGSKTGKKGKKRKKDKSPLLSVFIKLALLVFGILLITFLVMNAFEDVTFWSVTDGFSSFMEQFSPGDGYPYEIDSNSVEAVNISGTKLVLLTNDSNVVFNSTAKKVYTLQHTYTSPSMKVKNGRMIVFDRGSGRFRIQTTSKLLYEKTMDSDILTAAIGKKGNCAVVTKSISAASTLTVFDKNLKEIFVWDCSNEYISDISLSDNGKSAAVIAVGSENAEIYSRLLIFDFDKDEPVASFDFNSTTLFNVIYHSNGKISAQGDNRRVLIEGRKTVAQDESLGTDSYTSFSEHESGKCVLVRSDFGGSNNRLQALDAKGKLLFEKELDSSPVSIACDSNYVVVLTGSSLQFLSNSGNVVKEFDAESSEAKVVTNNGVAYVISNGSIRQYKVSNSSEETSNV